MKRLAWFRYGTQVSPKANIHFKRPGNKSLLRQNGWRNLLPPGQRVPFRNCNVVSVAIYNKPRKFGRITLRGSDEANIEVPLNYRFHLRKGFHARDLQ